jgi:hypothetical protein
VVLLGDASIVFCLNNCCYFHPSTKTCHWRLQIVRPSSALCSPLSHEHDRKLKAIDYLGSILTLVGCGLIILPLIWVHVILVHSAMQLTSFSVRGVSPFPGTLRKFSQLCCPGLQCWLGSVFGSGKVHSYPSFPVGDSHFGPSLILPFAQCTSSNI